MYPYYVRAQRGSDHFQIGLNLDAPGVTEAEAKALELLRGGIASGVWCQAQNPQPMQEGEDFFILDVLRVPPELAEAKPEEVTEAMAGVAQAIAPDVQTVIPAGTDPAIPAGAETLAVQEVQ